MADTDKVFALLKQRQNPNPNTVFGALTPNMKGLEGAIEARAKEVGVFAAASESFSQKNINCSINESIVRFEPVCKAALDAGLRLRAGVSCVLGCPFEGKIAPEKVLDVVKRLFDLGCYEVAIADTIGTGTVGTTSKLLECVLRDIDVSKIGVHFHDTYGQAVSNTYTSLQFGVSTIDCAASGLGGCPFAPGATGNVATEDVVYLCHGLGIETGVDLDKLIEASTFIDGVLGQNTSSKVGKALRSKKAKASA
jgi:hydroxymethylglutaryl-CoA lyase